jgi:WD40 repeat protein
MTMEDALALVEKLLPRENFKDIQRIVFQYAWQGWTYPHIAQHTGYDPGHIRDTGYELWQMLSRTLGEKVTKKNVHTVLLRHSRPSQAATLSPPLPLAAKNTAPQPRQHWDEWIDVSLCHGRETELQTLTQWLLEPSSSEQSTAPVRLITVVGMGGMGKTTLVAKLATQVQGHFDAIIWQTLRNKPPFMELLQTLPQVFHDQPDPDGIHSPEQQVSTCLSYLRTYRCLWILDNVETILPVNEQSDGRSQFGSIPSQDEFPWFETLLRRVGTEMHQSCVILTSREKIRTLASLEGIRLPIRSFPLGGLQPKTVHSLLQRYGCQPIEPLQVEQLVAQYGGNPLALGMIATLIQDLFEGEISPFLAQENSVFGDIQSLLSEQFHRLGNGEKNALFWLAIHREGINLDDLCAAWLPASPELSLMDILQSLGRRCLLEKQNSHFTLQPVVMEYVGQTLIDQIFQEIKTLQPSLFLSHALIQAQTKDYIRASQTRTLLRPLCQRLQQEFPTQAALVAHLMQLLHQLKSLSDLTIGYGGGNLLNLYRELGFDLSNYDFSGLKFRQAYCVGMQLHGVNFAQATFNQSVFTQANGAILAVALDPSHRWLAVGDDRGELSLWQLEPPVCLWLVPAHHGQVLSITWQPDGATLVTSSTDGKIHCWQSDDGRLCHTLTEQQSWVRRVTCSPDGKTLASADAEGILQLWDWTTGQLRQTLPAHDNWVRALSWHPDSTLLASGSADGAIKLWNPTTGAMIACLAADSGWILTLAWSPDGKTLASSGADGQVRLWDWSTGRIIRQWTAHDSWVWALKWCCLSPSKSSAHSTVIPASTDLVTDLVTGSADSTIKLWDSQTGELKRCFYGHANQVWSVDWCNTEAILISGGNDHQVKLWDGVTGQIVHTLQGQTQQVWSVQWSPDGTRLVSGHNDTQVRIWHAATGQLLHTLSGHHNWVRTVAWSPEGQLIASGGADGTVKLWDAESGAMLRSLTSDAWIRCIAWNAEGTLLASAGKDPHIRLWNPVTGQLVTTLKGHQDQVWAIAWGPRLSEGPVRSHWLASVGNDGSLRLWDSLTGKVLKTLQADGPAIQSLAWSACGQYLAIGTTDCRLQIWHVPRGTQIASFQAHTNWIGCLAWLDSESTPPPGEPSLPRLASGSDDYTIKLWHLQPPQMTHHLTEHSHWVSAIAWSPHCQQLASGSSDEQIRIWDPQTGHCLRTLTVPKPYEGMNIKAVVGLTPSDQFTLQRLGARG